MEENLQVHIVPALKDNYIYLVERPGTQACAAVDPAEAAPVERALAQRGLRLEAILLTHHHRDHVGGVAELTERHGPIPVYGPARERERIRGMTVELYPGDEVEYRGETARILALPGHTLGHIGYYFPRSGHLFAGDVLFGGGCGRVFEGTPAQMHRTLERLAELPGATRVWVGHEYTADNLRFALTVDPHNPELQRRAREVSPPTVPLVLEEEKRTNPFLRCHLPELQRSLGTSDPVEAFAELRSRKDRF